STTSSDEDEESAVDSEEFNQDGESSTESGGDLTGLFDRLNSYIEETNRNPSKIFADMKKKSRMPFRTALFDILVDKKEELAPLLNERGEAVKRLNCSSEKLDNMLFDCLAGADLGPPSPEPGEEIATTESQYKFQLQAIKIKHTDMLEELEQSRGLTEKMIDNIVDLQIPFRPIAKDDHRRLVDTSNSRYAFVEQRIKKSTVNAVMLINNKCLDARRRRRNFTKDTTDILTAWFNEHIDHPYPTDDEKNELAYHCKISVQQITNWFGNRRVRQKRQTDRPLQPPSPKKKGEKKLGGQQLQQLQQQRRSMQQVQHMQHMEHAAGPRQLVAVPDHQQ
ncbi:hypothetical protein PFISCL1PPCAC_26754, partial [Pristionchus fissidentatus]